MSVKNRNDLKQEFVSGTAATEQKFEDVFDSHYNVNQDSVLMGPIGMTGTFGLIGPTGPTSYNGLIGPDGATHYIGLWLDFESAAPTGPTSSGEPGQTIYEEGPSASYLYICIGINTWIRVSAEDTF